MKITIASSSEDSLILTGYIIDVEGYSNYYLNVIISLGHIPCLNFFTRMLYMWKLIIANTTMSD